MEDRVGRYSCPARRRNRIYYAGAAAQQESRDLLLALPVVAAKLAPGHEDQEETVPDKALGEYRRTKTGLKLLVRAQCS